jgi:glucokinase
MAATVGTRMVADVGGTNTRIALFDPDSGTFHSLSTYINREYTRLEDIVDDWLSRLEGHPPELCCIAVAAPLSGDRVVMSNINWSFSCDQLASQFHFQRLRRLNDFEANAYALPHLQAADLVPVQPARNENKGRLATVGPGTGLGGAFLDWFDGVPKSFACEPGHMGLAPGNELELAIFQLLLRSHPDVYAELLVSGPGLERLHQALAEIQGEPAGQLAAAEISRQALAGSNPLCVLALETFCALLGSACGDFLLATGSWGGLYLAGGIVPRMTDFLKASTFTARLAQKGAMRDILSGIPVYAITADQPGLLGAAYAPL